MKKLSLLCILLASCNLLPISTSTLSSISSTATQLNQQRIQEENQKQRAVERERELKRREEASKQQQELLEKRRQEQLALQKAQQEDKSNREHERNELETTKARAREEEAKKEWAEIELKTQQARIEAEEQERLTIQAKAEERKKFVEDTEKLARIEKQRKAVEAEKKAKEEANYKVFCGEAPKLIIWDNSLAPVRAFLKRTAHDPDSIEYLGCSLPVLTTKKCWVSTCAIRGKNVFGARILRHIQFYMTSSEVISSTN